MHRSASTTRASDEFFINTSSQPPLTKAASGADLLPIYNPLSDAAKKEASRRRAAESAVHLIPLVLIVCGLVLWLFSYPVLMATEYEYVPWAAADIKEPNVLDINNQTCKSNCKTTRKLERAKRIEPIKTVVRA